MRASLLAALLLELTVPALAQHNHEFGHKWYRNWVNSNNQGCCNNQDCGQVADDDERVVGGRLEVRIRGVGLATGQEEWCPVLPRHYLKSGNAPNWSASHACVSGYYGAVTPCAQFICYQPKPLF